MAEDLTVQRGELSARLRNLLRLRGTVRPDLMEQLLPVILAGDLDQPAYRETVKGFAGLFTATGPHPVSEWAVTVALNPGTPGAATIFGYKVVNVAVGVDYDYRVQIANRAFEGALTPIQCVDTDHFGTQVGVAIPHEVPVRMALNTGYSSLGLRTLDHLHVDQFPAGPLASMAFGSMPLTLRGDSVLAFVVTPNIPVEVIVWGVFDPDAPSQ